MTSSTKSGIARSTCSMPCSSFRQGMMTVMDWPLYMRAGLFRRRARVGIYHGFDEAPCCCFSVLSARWCARRTLTHCAHGVRASDGPRAWTSTWRTELTERPHLPGRDRPQTGRRRVHGPALGEAFPGASWKTIAPVPDAKAGGRGRPYRRPRTPKPTGRSERIASGRSWATHVNKLSNPASRRRSAAPRAPSSWWTPSRAR